MSKPICLVLATLGVVATLLPSAAHAVAGVSTIDAKELVKLAGCGRDLRRTPVQIVLEDDGRWSLSLAGLAWSGTYEPRGGGGRKVDLTPDDEGPLLAYLAAELTALCGTPITGVVVTPRRLLAKVNRRGTKVSLKIVNRLEGTGKGRHRLGGKGTLGPPPSTTLPSTSTSTIVSTTSTIGSSSTSSTSVTSSTTSTTTSITTTSSSTSSSTSTSVPTTTSTSTTLVSGCFFDTGLTIIDVCNDLEWEKKDGADAAPGSGSPDIGNPHDVDNIYYWAGSCSIGGQACQPNSVAAAECVAGSPGATSGCSECGPGEGTCGVSPPAVTTVWDFLAQVNLETFAGHSDWQLPPTAGTVGQPTGQPGILESIVDPGAPGCGASACIEAIFGPTVAFGYWSALEDATNPNLAWAVDFGGTFSDPFVAAKTSIAFGRAVRPRPPTCDDGLQNGTETGVDCGGEVCPGCSNDGDPCTSDGECRSGSCNQAVCGDGRANIGAPCDSDPDCVDGWLCDGGVCLGGLSQFCVLADQCATGFACDLEGSGRCRVPTSGACALDADCAANATCDPLRGVCVLDLNETCLSDEDCDSGLCSCGVLTPNQCPEGESCPLLRCIQEGVCKTPLGEPCTDDGECPVAFQDGDPVSEGTCSDGLCAQGLLFLGAVCEFGPPGGLARCVGGANDDRPCSSIADCPDGSCVGGQGPKVGDSPNDELCASGACFKTAGGDFGPCTPVAACSEATMDPFVGAPCSRDSDCPGGTCLDKCGNPTNPADYKCCRPDDDPCTTDFDCCGAFLDRARGCKSADEFGVRHCGPLSVTNEPCTTTDDCLRRGQLECLEGFCGGPPAPPVLAIGTECNPTPDVDCADGACDGVCGTGLLCLNCEPEGRGYRCADAAAPCCNSGSAEGDEFFCGFTILEGGDSFANQCCNYACVDRLDAQHCGRCGNDCDAPDETVCLIKTGGQCLDYGQRFGGVRCREFWGNKGLCPDPNPLDDIGVRCEAVSESAHECVSYQLQPPGVPLEPFCTDSGTPDGRPCSVDDQCEDFCGETPDCVCGDRTGQYNDLFDVSPAFVCSCR